MSVRTTLASLAFVCLTLSQAAHSQATRVVSNLDAAGWLIGPFTVSEEVNPPTTEFASGPGAPGVGDGTGSFRAQITEAGSKIILLRNDLHDIRLDRLQELSFCTYVTSGSNPNNWYVNLYVDADGDGTYDGRLDFVPPTGDLNTWECWDSLEQGSERGADPVPPSNWITPDGVKTLAAYLADHPDARINAFNTPQGGALRFNQGDTAATYVGFDGYLDGIRVKIAGGATGFADSDDSIYDFGPRTPVTVQSVSETADAPTPTDNDYTRINNAVQAMTDGDHIVLEGTFDWTEPNAAASWAAGSDGVDDGGTNDDYSILVPILNDGAITAASLGDARIQGPGDLPSVNLEGVFVLYNGGFRGWTFSNLEIFDFDLSIGMFFNGGTKDSFDDVEVVDNHIRIPSDIRTDIGDANQNIGIHFAFGDQQRIADNLIEIPGDGASDSAMSSFAASVAMQSNTAGTVSAYDGLRITGNQIHVLNAPNADPEFVYGIWENGGSHGADIEISGNEFVNLSPSNVAADNLQRAFRIHSQSAPIGARGAEEIVPTVRYTDNLVVGANIGFKWIEGFGSDWDFSPHGPVLLRGNTILDNGTGVAVRSAGEGRLRCNRIAGNDIGVSGITAGGSGDPFEYEDAEAIDAADNWWGCNQGPDMGSCDTTDGFTPIDLSSWFELSASSPESNLEAGESADVTALLASNAVEPAGCAFPDTATAFFSAVGGSMAPETAPVLGATAMSSFTAGGGAAGTALVTVDNQTVPVAFAIENDETDLAIEKTSGLFSVDLNDEVTYTIEVSNLGPSNVVGATVTDTFPADLTGCEWTCVDTGGASCGAKAGTDDITDTIDLEVGSMVTYVATCQYVPAGIPGDLDNVATVTLPMGVTDTNLDNNEDSDFIYWVGHVIFVDDFESGDTLAWN